MPLQLYKIASVEVGSAGAGTIAFSSIPQGYTDLKIVMSARCNNSSIVNVPRLTFNGSTTGYSGKYVEGDGASTFANNAATDGCSLVGVTAATATANTFGNLDVYIPNYASARYKSVSSDQVTENNATTAYADLQSYLWSNTAAITSITITPNSSASFVQYTTATLYGIL